MRCCDGNHMEVISRDNPIKMAVLYLCQKPIDPVCVLGANNWAFSLNPFELVTH